MVECDALLLRVDQILVLVKIVRNKPVCIHRHTVDAKELISLQSSGAAAAVTPVCAIQIFQSRLFSRSSRRHSKANCLLLIAGNGFADNLICYTLSFIYMYFCSCKPGQQEMNQRDKCKDFFFQGNASTQSPFHTWKGKKNLLLSVKFKTEEARVNLSDLLPCMFFLHGVY